MRTQSVDGSVKRIVATAITVVIVVFIIAVSYVFYGKDEVASIQGQNSKLLAESTIDSEVLNKAYELDSDKDGLADWEEVLWSTDPYNSDTDGDGITDSDELFSSEDTLSTNLGSENTSDENADLQNDNTPQTSTEVLAKDIFSSYMYSLQKGTKLSPEEQEVMINNAIQNVAPLVQAPTYTEAEVHQVPATRESRTQYITTMKEKITTMITSTDNEDAAFAALTQENNEWAIQILTDTVHAYTKYITELRSIDVPEDAVALHVNLLQSLLQYTFAIEGFTFLNSDPLRTAAAVNVFQGVRERLVHTTKVFATYVEFSEEESNRLQNTN